MDANARAVQGERMRLINADMLRDKLKEIAHDRFSLSDEYEWFLKGLLAADDAIRSFPTFPDTMVEIVRCKDCQYFEESRNGWGRCTKAVEILINGTDFCSFGERI